MNIDGKNEYLYAKAVSAKRATNIVSRLNSYKGYSTRVEAIEVLTDAERQMKLIGESIRGSTR